MINDYYKIFKDIRAFEDRFLERVRALGHRTDYFHGMFMDEYHSQYNSTWEIIEWYYTDLTRWEVEDRKDTEEELKAFLDKNLAYYYNI